MIKNIMWPTYLYLKSKDIQIMHDLIHGAPKSCLMTTGFLNDRDISHIYNNWTCFRFCTIKSHIFQ